MTESPPQNDGTLTKTRKTVVTILGRTLDVIGKGLVMIAFVIGVESFSLPSNPSEPPQVAGMLIIAILGTLLVYLSDIILSPDYPRTRLQEVTEDAE